MSSSVRTVRLILLPVLTLILGWQLGARTENIRFAQEQLRVREMLQGGPGSGSGQIVKGDPEKVVDISIVWSVWRLLNSHYIDPSQLQIRKMVYGAASGLTAAVGDPYTVFMTPSDNRAFEDAMSGTLEGIGAQMEVRDGHIMIVAPLKRSPAEKAGLKPKDVVIAVNAEDVTGMKLEDVVGKIRGPKGTSVTLSVVHDGGQGPVEVTIRRASIHVPSVETKTVQTATGSIAYIALNQFGDTSIEEMRKAVIAVDPSKVKGIILDLRYNGGGYLEGAVDLVSMFLQQGNVVTVHERDKQPAVQSVSGEPILATLPLAVLVNAGTASASEITAGALQDAHRATIVGTQSFGKGTVQQIIALPDGSSLRVTIAKWLTPSGHDLSKKGITPDIVIDRTEDDFQADRDPQLDSAVTYLLTGKRPEIQKSSASSVSSAQRSTK